METKQSPTESEKGKVEFTERPKGRHHYLNLTRGFSFSYHSHGRVNRHSIGLNHEPGTLNT